MKKFFNLFFIFSLLISNLLFINFVHAEEDFYGNCTTSFFTGQDGTKYCIPREIDRDPYYKQAYRNMIANGSITKQNVDDMIKLADGTHKDHVKTSFFENLKSLLFADDSIYNNEFNGALYCLLNDTDYLANFGFKNEKGIGGCRGLVKYTNVKPNYDSGKRNYYTKPTRDNIPNSNKRTNIINTGPTTHTTVVNRGTQNLRVYNNVNQTFNNVTYRNETYNIYNNTYSYTTNNYTYNIKNEYNYTTVNYIGANGDEGTSKYYFMLPDGSNSFNAKPEDLKGLKLDFVIKNYDTVNDNDKLLGLYHFNGDTKDSSTKMNNIVDFPTLSYVSNKDNFGSYPVLTTSRVNLSFSTPFVLPSNEFTIEFRYYNGNVNHGWDDWIFGVDYGGTYIYLNKYHRFNEEVGSHNVCDRYNTERTDVSWRKCLEWRNVKDYAEKFQSFKQFINKKIDSVNDYSGQWRHVAIVKSGNVLNIFENGQLLDSVDGSSLRDSKVFFNFRNNGFSYFDELRINNKALYSQNFVPPVTQYDSNLFYVLPKTESNNTILVQSMLQVNGQQIGGKRPSINIPKGYVFAHVDDDNVIDVVEQYDGSNWVAIKSSVFSKELNKWVNLVGYSIVNKDIVKIDDNSSNNGGSTIINNKTPATNIWDFLTKGLPELINSLSNLTDSVGGILNSLISLFIPKNLDFLNDLHIDDFKQKIGILALPYDLGKELLSIFLVDNNKIVTRVFTFNSLSFNGVVLVPSFTYDFNTLINENGVLYQFYSFYLMFIDFIVYISLFRLLQNKINSILNK